MKTVLVFGTFDNLHPGHLNFLQQAKKHGDVLNIVVARDANVLKLKGRQPQQTEKTRQKKLQQLKIAQQVFLGNKNYQNRLKIIAKIRPDIICLGYDQPKLKLPKIKIVRLKSYFPQKYKSSLFAKKEKPC